MAGELRPGFRRRARLGFDERFGRMWRFYLAWCNAGFAADYIDVMQVTLQARP